MPDDPLWRTEDEPLGNAPPGYHPVRWLTPVECAASAPRGYIIKGLLAPCDLLLIYGGPGMGKSCIAPLLAYSIAQGMDVFGRRVRQGRVLYVASEDPHGMRIRIAALKVRHGDALDMLLGDGLAGFMDPTGPAVLELSAKVATVKPAVVIFDTLAAGFHGLKENDPGSDGMGRVVEFARQLIGNHGVAVVILHHVPKADSGTPRGHGILLGAADVALALSRKASRRASAAFTKNRNGPSDGALYFSIEPVTLGKDDDGDPITAPIAIAMDDPGHTGPRLSPQEKNALEILQKLIEAEGKSLPTETDDPASAPRCISEKRWQTECGLGSLSGAENPSDRDRAFRRVAKNLKSSSMVSAKGEWVWIIPQQSRFFQ